jgi:hypothetical protein
MKKLGTIIIDKVTGSKGMLTIYALEMSGNQNYLFQPKALNPTTKEPVDTFWITEDRIVGGEEVYPVLPINVLGTEVEDTATGFKGISISLYYHINGCVHVEVKAKGTIPKTGETIKSQNVDIRRLKGKAIKKMTEPQMEKSKIEKPSPEFTPSLFKR